MNGKQWLAVTALVILNIIVFGTLLGRPAIQPSELTSTWTPLPTFTPMPFPTATAILMPTLPPPTPTPLPVLHVVVLGETVENIATAYGLDPAALRAANGLDETADVRPGQQLIIPPAP